MSALKNSMSCFQGVVALAFVSMLRSRISSAGLPNSLATCSMMASVVNMPCGLPKDRTAELDGKFV
eukprot:CAMPEP_0176136894 /NCGR_PEP_ID=MMETSP0120_2-20121206/69485_1 /TAXON_ID=160619 /ORGANISM="Kryptoperidinium foliaceum, Strain CCMP 1326" /LENGTH=65 /DNA_ID=CAMNT_0017472703 /DNA_START=43 /DNA_END=237 /DNA_ORIENTATION=+